LFSRGKISVRFRRISISLFTAAFIITAAVMFFAFEAVTTQISAEYAGRYAGSSAEAMSTHITKEIGLMSIAANSADVIDWFMDEFNEDKKVRAFEVFSGIVSQLYSYNLYIGLESSLNEYRAETGQASGNIQPVAVLSPYEPVDAWFFNCIESEMNYTVSIDIDHMMQRKRVWLDYKVVKDGVPIGVLCTGLEFSHIAGELFSQYETNNMRGIIINRFGDIYMDSSLMGSSDYLHSEYIVTIRDEFSDRAVINAIEEYLVEISGHRNQASSPSITRLTSGQYRFMTLAPIMHTDWSIIILSGTTTLFDTMYFVPIMITILALLIVFAVVNSIANFRMLFQPLRKLEDSLAQLNEHSADALFGTERDDELGHLSNTIQDLFNKANIDPLTGLYNRRFMESSMERIMGLLSRSKGHLSVMMLDIDFFKRYNDTYGHDRGDKCLKSVAGALSNTVSRVNDIVVRYGGEEFTVILPNTESEGAKVFAEKLLKNVRDLNIPHEKNDAAPHVTVSLGVTTGIVDFKQDLHMYLKNADEALYMSKENGRNRYTYLDFNP